MTREENLHWIDQEIRTWENECQSKHPIKEALYAARKALEQKPCEDAVSRAEVLNLVRLNAFHAKSQIKAIENMPSVTPQEHFKPMVEIDLYSVIKQKYIEREVLDKIRAEIMKLDDINPDYPMDRTIHISRNEVLQIIGKYRAESEEENESNNKKSDVHFTNTGYADVVNGTVRNR